MIEWLYNKKDTEGIYNCAAPNAVSNYDFMKLLRQATHYRLGLPAYSWMLEAGALLIGTETELMLKSRWVIPARAIKEGFDFKYKYLKDALTDIVAKSPRRKYHLF
jgi:NAD dependent epimerase/dehydratase family enzyme